MSRQSSLDGYFKCKSSAAHLTKKSSSSPGTTSIMCDLNITKKRRSLSLVKNSTPKKVVKTNNRSETRNTVKTEVVNLCSDDENMSLLEDKDNLTPNTNLSQASNSSQSTIIYNLTPSTPKKSTQSTPTSSSSKSIRSPNSDKFFSPTKKRAVFKRTPVKKKLAMENFRNCSQLKSDSFVDEDFSKACEGMDDKSIFLLTIINKCLKDDKLKTLLGKESVELLNQCYIIVKPGNRLVCRLYWRQHGWYRMEKLIQITNDKKDQIGESQFLKMLNCLVENGLVEQSAGNTMDFDDMVKVLKGEEIKQVCKSFKLKIQTKQEAEKALRSFSQQKSISNFFTKVSSNNSQRVLQVMRSKVGPCYKLSDHARIVLDKLYLLMYLGINYEAIRDKRLELMLINDKIKRETYPIDKEMKLDNASVVFRSEEEFLRYWNAHVIYEDYLAKVNANEKLSIVISVFKLYKEIDEEEMTRYEALPTWLRRYTPPYLYVKVLQSGIQELKKDASHHQLALDILTALISQTAFRQHKRAEWYAEKALVLHKLMARHDEAAEVLIEGLKSSMSEEAKDAMRPRANKIANQQNIQVAPALKEALLQLATKHLILENTFHADHVMKHHMETVNQRGKKKFVVHTDDGKKFLDAENFCIQDYTSKGDYTHGEHWEGRIATTIYHLLFWDIIYTRPVGVGGVFLSRYQLHPLDMYDEGFYLNRRTLINERLAEIENMTCDEMVESMRIKWDERPEHELSGINRGICWENVRMVGSCLGARAAAALCRRLATNYGYSHSGFPDLTLWNIHTKKIKFVEVKTDTDKPSMKQLQWMRYLREHDVDTGFCYVGAETARSRARAAPGTGTGTGPGPGSGPAVTVKSVADINSGASTFS